MYKEIYFKTEPAGEIGFGQLNENDIEAIKSLGIKGDAVCTKHPDLWA